MTPKYFLPVFLDDVKRRAPCPRNRRIYDAVKVGRLTQRAAAVQFKVSPGRIGQILAQVESWIGRTGGGPARAPRERLRVSEYLHRERADACYGLLVEAFRDGKEVTTNRVRVVADKPEERIVTLQTVKRDPRFVLSAWKVEEARHAFEVDHSHLPPEELTAEERVREAGILAAETLAEAEANYHAEQERSAAPDEFAYNPQPAVMVDEVPEPEPPPPLPPSEPVREEPVAAPRPLPPPLPMPKKPPERSDQPRVVYDRYGRIIYQFIPAPKEPPVDQGHYFGPRRNNPPRPRDASG